ncbi:MAG: hypothetical protein ABJA34_00850, partial [Pseudonocardiales bacterium]
APSGTPTAGQPTPSGGTTGQITRVPTGGVPAGAGSTAGLRHVALLALGGILVLGATILAGSVRRTRRAM